MANVYIKTVSGGEDTTPAGTDAIELDDGTTSKYALLSNLYKAIGSGTQTAATALRGDGTYVATPTLTSTDTLTNKRITQRVVAVTVSATPAINVDNGDIFTITTQNAAITSMTTNLTGTPTSGQKMMIEILDDATPRAITWGASFASGPATLPTTTTASKWLYVGLEWSASRSKWICLAQGNEA